MRTLSRALALVVLVCGTAGPAWTQQTREHILLFSAQATRGTETLPRGTSVAIDDTLAPGNPLLLDPDEIPGEGLTFVLGKPAAMSVVSDVNGRGVQDGETQWLAHRIKGAKSFCANDPGRACKRASDCDAVGGTCDPQGKFDRKDPRNQAVRVVDGFSDLRLDFNRETLLLEPASVDPATFIGLPPGSERYKCYQVKPTKKVCADNPRIACRRDTDCPGPGEVCTSLPKFPRQTHPDGLRAVVNNPISALLAPGDPERPYDLRGVKMFCQSADTQQAGAATPDARNAPQAGLLCYSVKAPRKACFQGDRDNLACRGDSDCPGGSCSDVPKFSNKHPAVQELRVEDAFLQHQINLRKEGMLCVPACKEPPAAQTFSPHVLRINGLSLDTTGHAFSPLAGIANPLVSPAVAGGSINILLEADQFSDGKQEIHGYTGSLDPGNLGCNVNNPAVSCQFRVAPESIDSSAFKTRTTCGNAGLIVLPVEVDGTDTPSTATLTGGDAGTSFSFELPFTDAVSLNLDVRQVEVSGTLGHDGSSFTDATGMLLEGAVIHREFKQTANQLPQGLCQGGGNDNEPCFLSNAMCPGGACQPLTGTCQGGSNNGAQCGDDSTCPDPLSGNPSDACVENYVGGFTPAQLAGFIDLVGRDLDLDGAKSCEGATNNGEPCSTLSDCPDQNGPGGAFCDQFEASSIRLLFTAIDAEITGVAP